MSIIPKVLEDVGKEAESIRKYVDRSVNRIQAAISVGSGVHSKTNPDELIQYIKMRTHVDRTATPTEEITFRKARMRFLRMISGAINQYTRSRSNKRESQAQFASRQDDIFRFAVSQEAVLFKHMDYEFLSNDDLQYCRDHPISCPKGSEMKSKMTARTPSPPTKETTTATTNGTAPASSTTKTKTPLVINGLRYVPEIPTKPIPINLTGNDSGNTKPPGKETQPTDNTTRANNKRKQSNGENVWHYTYDDYSDDY